jgi:hypothetical protein
VSSQQPSVRPKSKPVWDAISIPTISVDERTGRFALIALDRMLSLR